MECPPESVSTFCYWGWQLRLPGEKAYLWVISLGRGRPASESAIRHPVSVLHQQRRKADSGMQMCLVWDVYSQRTIASQRSECSSVMWLTDLESGEAANNTKRQVCILDAVTFRAAYLQKETCALTRVPRGFQSLLLFPVCPLSMTSGNNVDLVIGCPLLILASTSLPNLPQLCVHRQYSGPGFRG